MVMQMFLFSWCMERLLLKKIQEFFISEAPDSLLSLIHISFIKDRNDLPTGKAEKERKDTDYYDNSGSRQKQDV